ncbi:hypothetical protein TUMEXPCC7403_00975 [Tumidithrix helvetica PCC 7403]
MSLSHHLLQDFRHANQELIPFSKSDATHLFEKTALRAEHKTRSVAISREIGISILDLKAGFRGFKYVQEVLKLLPQKSDPILLASIFTKVANLGAIHSIPSFADTL